MDAGTQGSIETNNSMVIGAYNLNGSYPFEGQIDDIQIWNVALDSSQV